MQTPENSKSIPLCVDLDDTLVHTDTLLEVALKLLKQHPIQACKIPFWMTKGIAYTKHNIGKHARIDASLLPYDKDIIHWLRKERKKNGRTLCLATASDISTAKRIANHLGIFEHVIASDGTSNLSGEKKAKALIHAFGEKQFDYIGNSSADLHVWKHARYAFIAHADKSLIKQAKNIADVQQIFPNPHNKRIRIFLQEIRIHQWAKNLLLFVPILTAHKIANIQPIIHALLGFAAFSAIASSIYIFNDFMDLEDDRKHRYKRRRPLASGHMHITTGIASLITLVIIGIAIAAFLPPQFLFILALYIIINMAYSFRLKRIPLIDVVILASLYVIRIIAGSAATGIKTSTWLFLFAAFIFISLALVKRVSELTSLHQQQKTKAAGRGYTKHDRKTLTILGLASGYISLLILGFYVTSSTVIMLYTKPMILWTLLPLFFFWITRVWYLAYTGRVHEDPVIFASKDISSYIVAALAFVILVFAT